MESEVIKAIKAAWREFLRELKRQKRKHLPDPFKEQA